MVQIHRKHLIYGQNCLKDRLIGLLGVAHNCVTDVMESSAVDWDRRASRSSQCPAQPNQSSPTGRIQLRLR